MVNYVLAFDPGRSTGIALLSYEDDSPARLGKKPRGPPKEVLLDPLGESRCSP